MLSCRQQNSNVCKKLPPFPMSIALGMLRMKETNLDCEGGFPDPNPQPRYLQINQQDQNLHLYPNCKTRQESQQGFLSTFFRRADTQTPSVFSTHSDTSSGSRIGLHTRNLKAFVRQARIFKTHRHAVYQCFFKGASDIFRHTSASKTRVPIRASVFKRAFSPISGESLYGGLAKGGLRYL